MNSKILDSIFHGELKPWLVNIDDDRILKEILRTVSKLPTNNLSGIEVRLKMLMQPFPALQRTIVPSQRVSFTTLSYSCNLPVPSTLLNHYYKAVIDAETIRYYNETQHNPFIKDYALDVPFQIGEKSLKGIAILANQVNNELADNIENRVDENTRFALTYIRNSLIALYFSIQDKYSEHLSNVYDNVDDFYLYCIDCDKDKVSLTKLEKVEQDLSKPREKSNALTFGFKGDISQLTNLVKVLVLKLDFLNEGKTTVEQFIEVFTAKDLKEVKTQIHVDCATNEFQEIMDQMKFLASKFTPTTINKSRLFYTKEGTLIDDNLLYVTKSKSKLAINKKEQINAIFQNIRKEKG